MISLLFSLLFFFVFGQLRHLDGKITKAMMANRIAELLVETRRAEEDYLRTGAVEKAKAVIENLQQITAIAGRTRTNLVMPQDSMKETARLAGIYEAGFREMIQLKQTAVAKEDQLNQQGLVLENAVSQVLAELKNNPQRHAAVISAGDSLSTQVDKITLANKILKEGHGMSQPKTSWPSNGLNFARDLRNHLIQKWDHDVLMDAASSYANTFEEVGGLQEKLNVSAASLHQSAQALEAVVLKTRKELDENRDNAKRAVVMVIFAAFLICGFLGLSLSIWFSQILTGPLLRLRNAMLRIAEGDMDAVLDVHSSDEIGELARSFQAMQSRLKDSYEDLHQSNARLAEKTHELERSNQEFEQFAHVISHDLKEPVRTVSIYADLLAKRLNDRLEGKEKDYVQHMLSGCQWMYALIDDLLTYARMGGQDEPVQMTDTGNALNKALENLTAVIQKNQAQISRDKLPAVFANGTQLTQLFQNLIANAIKFRRGESPKVHIGAERRDKEWCFSVQDNGIGIHPEHTERIFVVFQRLHTRKEYPGTGIGLAVCKKIVERHKGSIWMESKPGVGSVFYFTIPLDPEAL